MKPITIIKPDTGTSHTFANEETLRSFLNNDLLSFKDRRLFKLQAMVRTATVGQIPEILDSFHIENEQS